MVISSAIVQHHRWRRHHCAIHQTNMADLRGYSLAHDNILRQICRRIRPRQRGQAALHLRTHRLAVDRHAQCVIIPDLVPCQANLGPRREARDHVGANQGIVILGEENCVTGSGVSQETNTHFSSSASDHPFQHTSHVTAHWVSDSTQDLSHLELHGELGARGTPLAEGSGLDADGGSAGEGENTVCRRRASRFRSLPVEQNARVSDRL
mmetsp:Transcript_25201/g.61017  ORF Transcript_25201/g.61017 Transcript_25201/m.61017 type:complete len:209 (-) Transcript_25201:2088-2714(-)